MDAGFFGDVFTWIHDEDIDKKIFRIYRKNSDNFYKKGKFLQVVELPNDFLIGILYVDDEFKACGQTICFLPLSDIEFYYLESDQEIDKE